MPNDETHLKASAAAYSLAALVMWHYSVDILTIIYGAIIFMFGAAYVSPDLDINSKPYRRWGVFRLLWKPYTDYVPHRGKLSHHIIIGPIALGVWLTVIVVLVIGFFMVFWVPFIEPAIDSLKDVANQLVTLQIESETWKALGFFYVLILSPAVVHIIVDKLMKGDRSA